MFTKRLWIVVVLSIPLAVAGCATAMPTPTPIPISTVSPGADFLGDGGEVIASGIVIPAQESNLSFAITGLIKSVEVSIGDEVKAGDLLVELDATDAVQAVGQAKAQQSLAELGVTQAEVNLALAQANLNSIAGWSPNQNAVAAAEAALANAEASLKQAQSAYDQVAWLPSVSGTPQSLQLEQATNSFNVAKANLDYINSGRPDVSKARAQVDLANVSLEQSKVNLEIARLNLEAAQHSEGKTALRAPFDGNIVSVEITPGEVAMPGQLIIVLADLNTLQVETTDLSERDISKVKTGQSAQVYVKALNSHLEGHVARIAPQATTLGGDVVYKVTIALDEQLEGLLWGMSVEVQIEVGSDK
ncbi:MAG: efflux RND transporter periplasmic adaptor subunit [Anaerolineae bacterium]|nr:efflux RND transporter periplasmic adaptor subunit [Anaerolineae bacterium]